MKKVLKFLFLLLLFVFPFGQLTRLPLRISSVNVYFHDILIVSILLFWLIDIIFKKKKVRFSPLAKLIFAFAGVAFFSFLLSVSSYSLNESLVAILYLFRWVAYGGIYLVIINNQWLKKELLKGLLFASVFSVMIGLIQYFFLPDTRFLFFSGWDDHYYRLIGSFLDPGFTGMIYVLALVFLIKIYRQDSSRQLFYWLFLVLLYWGIALTYARSVYLAFLTAMLIIFWQKRKFKWLIAILILFSFTIALLPRPLSEGVHLERTASVKARLGNWQQALRIIKDHPFFGVGFNFYRYAQRDYGFLTKDWQFSHSGAGADSSLLFIWATTGMIGFLVYCWLLIVMVKIFPALVLPLIIHSFFNNSLFYPWIMLWLWIVLAIQ